MLREGDWSLKDLKTEENLSSALKNKQILIAVIDVVFDFYIQRVTED